MEDLAATRGGDAVETDQVLYNLTRRGIGVLITDHNVRETLDLIDRAYILHEGRLLMDGEFGSLVTRGVEGDDVAQSAAYDRDGNGIVAGSFAGNVDFAPGGINVYFNAAAGSGDRGEIGPGLDAVRQDRMRRAVQAIDATAVTTRIRRMLQLIAALVNRK